MKAKLLFTFSIFWVLSAFAQFEQQQIISTSTLHPYKLIPSDIDNDGFVDVLSASLEFQTLSWYRNLDGAGNFGPEIIINEIPVYYLSVDFVDLDNDGDKDILYLSNNPRYISWLENLDGADTFGLPQILIWEDYIQTIITTDMDEDGDLDLVASITVGFSGKIVWYENIDGQGTFGEENLLIENWEEFFKIVMFDMDGDGKKDILAVGQSYYPAALFWYKNLGNATFGDAQLIYQFRGVTSELTRIVILKVSDINTDGKKDIIVTAYGEFIGVFIYWIENLGLGNFGDLQYIDSSYDPYIFYDLDNDSDNDMIVWNGRADQITWRENENALGTFGTPKIITTDVDYPQLVEAADIDGDGVLDVISASRHDNKLA